ncbi:MAG: mycofactocin biosynthesis chaperone MftB [Actinomycetota bacterium]|nr:mycofactocin biosynthesis chaperone MftB [Actinomycetota bacterium]
MITAPPVTSAWEPALRYRLDPRVALRPEPFGALAYHYDSRRLTFLRSPLLVDVVKSLEEHASAADAVDTLVPRWRRGTFLDALANLAGSHFITPLETGDDDADR